MAVEEVWIAAQVLRPIRTTAMAMLARAARAVELGALGLDERGIGHG